MNKSIQKQFKISPNIFAGISKPEHATFSWLCSDFSLKNNLKSGHLLG